MAEKNLYGFTPEQIELIRKTVAKDAVNEAEFQRFLYRASKLGLDPLDGNIHLLVRKRKNPDTGKWEKVNIIVIGIDGFRAVADRSGKLAGIKRDVIYDEKGRLVRAWAEVYRNDWKEPAREVVALREYCQTRDGKPTGLWATMPEALLKKCAEAAAHRMAFAAELAGIYIEEELPEENAYSQDKPKSDTKEASGKTDKPAKDNTVVDAEKPAGEKTSGEAEPFKGELIVIEGPNEHDIPSGIIYSATAFDPVSDKTYIIYGAAGIKDLNPNEHVEIEGHIKGNKINVFKIKKVKTTDNAESNTSNTGEVKASDTGEVTLEVKLKSQPKPGSKNNQKLLWAHAEAEGEKYIIAVYGDNMEEFKQAKEGDTVTVTGNVEETKKGKVLHVTNLKKTA